MKTSQNSEMQKSTLLTAVVMGCTMVSRLLGFVRMAVITGIFGAGAQADVINTAFSIPNNLRKLFAEGALSAAFIPVLSRTLVEDDTGLRARSLVSNLLTFQVLLLAPVVVGGIAAARPLVEHVLSEFTDPGMIAATAGLFRWLISYVFIISLSAVFMGILNAHQRFFVPAFSPILFSVAVIGAILTLHSRLGVYSVAVGVLTGGTTQLVFQYPLFHRLRYRAKPNLGFGNPDFRRILSQWLPLLATSSVFAITHQVAVRFATGLVEGSVTALQIAITFYQLPFGIFSASVTTVLFPRMSEQVARKDTEGLSHSFQYGIRFLLVLLVPSAVFMAVGSRQLIAVAFQRGEFTAVNTLMAAPVLIAYSLGLFSVGAFTFTQRFLYTVNRYRATFVTALVVAVVDISLSYWLKDTVLAVAGIALANTVAFTAGMGIMLCIAARELGDLHGKQILLTLVKTAAASALGALALWIVFHLSRGLWHEGSSAVSLGVLLGGAGVFTAVVLACYRALGVEMVAVFTRSIRKKL